MSDRAHPSCGTRVVGVLIALSPGRNVVCTTRPCVDGFAVRHGLLCAPRTASISWESGGPEPLSRPACAGGAYGLTRYSTSAKPPYDITGTRKALMIGCCVNAAKAPSRSRSTFSLRSLIWLASPRSDSLPAYRGPPPHSDPRRRSVRSRKGAGESFRTSGRRPRTPFRRGRTHRRP
jgi:hypothetical protein